MRKIFLIIFFIIIFINKSYENTKIQRQLETTAHNTGYNYGNHNTNYDSSSSCTSQKCKKTWKILEICLFLFLIFIFILIIICHIINRIRNLRISTQQNLTMNENNNIYLLKKHYLFQNDLKWIIYKNDIKNYGDECTICLENFIINKIRVCFTPCHHIFHFSCLKKYILKSNDTHCPNCKFDFFNLLEGKKIDYDLVQIDDSLPNNNIDHDIKEEKNKKKNENIILRINVNQFRNNYNSDEIETNNINEI